MTEKAEAVEGVDKFEQIIAFILELEKLKAVERRIKPLGQSRFENSAEHSWQVALLAMSLIPYASETVDAATVIKMLLLHDIVEIDTGDKFAYDANHLDTENETIAAKRIFSLLPSDIGSELLQLWMAFEHGDSPESRFAKGVDRLMPVLQNLHNEGQSWVEHGITVEQIVTKNAAAGQVNPELWAMVKAKVEHLGERGILAFK